MYDWQQIQHFLENNTSETPEVLHQLYREVNIKLNKPHMLADKVQGRLLSIISTIKRPRNILELGTYAGYSAYCLAEGLAPGGMIYTVESNPEIAAFAQKFFDNVGLSTKINLINSTATEAIAQLQDKVWDLIFMDADKENYPKYFELLWPHLQTNGCVLIDNIFWHGKIFDQAANADKHLHGIRALLEKVKNTSDATFTVLPVRDGLMIVTKH